MSRSRGRQFVRARRGLLALLAAGCTETHSPKDTTLTSITPADKGTTTNVVVPASSSRVTRDERIIAGARALLAAARPGFREWQMSEYAPALPDNAVPSATTGPLIGDFDGDGMPDVVFDGYDGHIMVTTCVLSNNGQRKIVSVEEERAVPDPDVQRRVRFVVAPYTLAGKRGQGVGIVSYDEFGNAWVPVTIRVYVDGHFAELSGAE